MYKSQENPQQQLSGEYFYERGPAGFSQDFNRQMFQMEQRVNSRYDVGSDNGVIHVSQELLPRGTSFKQSN